MKPKIYRVRHRDIKQYTIYLFKLNISLWANGCTPRSKPRLYPLNYKRPIRTASPFSQRWFSEPSLHQERFQFFLSLQIIIFLNDLGSFLLNGVCFKYCEPASRQLSLFSFEQSWSVVWEDRTNTSQWVTTDYCIIESNPPPMNHVQKGSSLVHPIIRIRFNRSQQRALGARNV